MWTNLTCLGNSKKISKKIFLLATAAILVGGFFVVSSLSAVGPVTISPASGGSAVSIDTTSAVGRSGEYATLSGPSIMEGSAGDISAGTHTFTLPAGWEFNTESNITVIRTSGDILPESQVVTPSVNSFTFTITAPSTAPSTLAFILNSMKVRPTVATLSTGEITHSGAAIIGVTNGSTNFGTLSTVSGVTAQLSMETQADGSGAVIGAQSLASASSLTAYAVERDQFGNFIGNVAATWSLGTKTGGVIDENLVAAGDNKSAVFTGVLIGTAAIHASANTRAVDSGLLTVIPSAVNADNSIVAVDKASETVSGGGKPVTATVTVKDAAGNVIPGATVNFNATGSNNTLSPASVTTNGNGVAAAVLTSTKAETKTVSATADGTLIAQTQSVIFVHDVASQLAVTQQPSTTATAGEVFAQQPVINVLDQFGNLVNDDDTTVITADRNSATGNQDLHGTLTATASDGVATFTNLSYQQAVTIKIDFGSGSLTLATSGDIAVSPNIPATVSFTQQPASSGTVDNILTAQPIVRVVDTYGNNVANGTSVTLSKASGAGDLRGTLTVSTTGGTATFSDIGYNKTDVFTITATAGVSATSGSVGPLSAGIINVFTLSATSPQIAGIAFSVSVSGAVDQYSNPASGAVTVSAFSGGGDSPSAAHPTYGAITVTAGSGSANTTLVNAVATVLHGLVGSISEDTDSITVSAGVQTQITLTSDKADIDADGTDSAAITAQLKDAYRNNAPVAGVGITFTTSKGAVSPTTAVLTDASGVSSATLTSGPDRTAGTANIGATSAGLTVTGVSVTMNDVTTPNTPVVTAPIVTTYTSATNYTITGNAEVNSLVQIYSGITVVASQQLSGGSTSFSINAPLTLNTANNFTVTAKDTAGNETISPASVSTINEDNINPSVTSYTLDNLVISPNFSAGIQDLANFDVAFSEQVNATIDIVDFLNAPVKHIYTSSGTVMHPNAQIWNGKNTANAYVVDGVYTIKIVITDRALNSITDITKTITVDNTAPTVALTYSANPAKAGAMTITATYSETIAGTPKISLDQAGSADISDADMTGSGAIWTYVYTVNTATGGTYIDGAATVSLSSINDPSGNIAASPTGNMFTIDTGVPAAPTVTLLDPINNANKTAATLRIVGETGTTYNYSIGTVTDAGTLTGGDLTVSGIDVSDLADGTLTASVTLTDAANNTSAPGADSATKDTVAPAAVETTPVAALANDPTPNLVITAESGAAWDIKNGLAVLNSGTGTGAAQTVTIASLTDNTYNLTLVATDAAGNQTTISLTQFAIDTANPALTLSSLFTSQTLTGGHIYPINWTSSDANQGGAPIKLEYSIDGGSTWDNPIVASTENDGVYNWTVPTINSSAVKIKITATDLAGNTASELSDPFAITYSVVTDITPPVVTLNSPNGAESYQGGSVQVITWTATDNVTPAGSLGIKLEYSSDGSANWNTITASTENDGAYLWTAATTATTNALIKVTATDAAVNSGSDLSNAVFTITTAPVHICTDIGGGNWTCDISLSAGWNLMSLPVIISNTAIADVLSGISGNIDTVQYYTPSDWLTYVPEFGGTLTMIEDGKGYWINMTNPATLAVTGTKAPAAPELPKTYSVASGWNLIGFKSTITQPTPTYLQSLPVGGYSLLNASNENKTSGYMDAGKGYWLWMNAAGSIATYSETE